MGMTEVHHNPDSWEGWYWGASHHWGGSMRVGQCETYGTVEDCLKEAEMIVFWSSNPESNSGAYGALEGTVRRKWLKEAGIKLVHIDPYFNDTIQFLGGKWIAPRPTTSPALAIAIAYVWITEDLYDKDYVATHTMGFETWRDYVLGGFRRHTQVARMARGRGPACLRATSGLWPGNGARRRPISGRARGVTVTAARAATPPEFNGREPWSVSLPCRDWASRA